MKRSLSPWPSMGDLSLVLLSSLAFSPLTNALSFQSVPSPNLDLSGLGSVMLAGDFDSISLYNYVGQDEDGLSPNGSQSLYGRYPTGVFAQLSSSDGYIESMCSFVAADGTLNGIVVGGNFTGFGDNPAPAAALFNPTDGSITALNGINGQISAVYCDNDASIVYVGGSFQGGNSTNAIAWVNGWTNLPFAGFNGPVSAITKLPNGHIVFGGSFTAIGNLTTMVHGLPTQPQVINVGSANVSATGATANPKYNKPSNIICSPPGQHSNTEFLLADHTTGAITADFGYGFIPTHLRLLNTQVDNRGTKTWSYTFFPNGGIANFTYYDDNGDQQSCTNSCPLAQNSTYQDFYFVNQIMMNSFRLDISDWYGQGAGMGGIELFQNSLWAYAVDNFNSPNCDGVANRNASATTTGPWVVSPSGDSMSQYLTANIPGGTNAGSASNYSVVFTPNIEQSGNYSINMWTPGCLADNTCATRGQVNITANLGSPTGTSSAPYTTTIYQTNGNLKFDQIYFGYVDVADGFRPSITLTPSSGQAGPLTIVAESLGLNLTSAFNSGRSSNSSNTTTTTSDTFSLVNGLYEYNPDMATSTSDSSNSTIDAAGVSLNNGAQVLALTMADGVLYAAGAFRTDAFQHIFSVGSGNATDLANRGLNDVVQSLFYLDGELYAGGNFSNTGDNSSTGLSNVATWSTSDKTWSALGAGVNGIVYDIVPLQVNVSGSQVQAVAVSGYFNQINAFDSSPDTTVNNIALWIPSRNNWLPNLDAQSIAIDGRLNAYTTVPNQDPIFAGALDSQDIGGSRNAAGLSSTKGLSLTRYPLNIQAPSTSASGSNAKRDIPQSAAQGAYTGYFYDENGLNLTIVGGRFEAMASNGSRISNLAILNGTDGTTVTGLGYNASSDASVYALATQNTTLFIGGSFETGILFYDLALGELASEQPPALRGNGGAAHAMALQPKSNNLYVGGTFGRAGSLGCAGLCIYDTGLRQWSPPPTALTGDNTINYLQWASGTRLVIAGELNVAGNRTTMAEYDTKSNEFTTVANANTVPGPITAFTSVDNSFTAAFAAGVATANSSAYLSHFDGKSTWTGIGGFGAQTKIQGLQIMSVNGGGSGNSLVPSGQTLLVMGMLELPSYGNVSAAFFNGTGFTPMALSTLDDGRPGSIYGAFVQNPANLLNKHSDHLALGFVVLIGLACALGVVFLIVVLGILIERVRRQREGYVPAPTGAVMYEKSGGGKIGDISADRLFGGVGKGGGSAPRI